MRKINTFLISIFIFLCTDVFAQKNDSTICLEIIGIAVHKTEPLDGVTIKLYKENEELVWEQITNIPYHDHSFSFSLLRNSHYSIEVSKDGYISRLVSIDTRIPDDVQVKAVNKFVFEFEVDLVKEIKMKDDFYIDFPIAIISYNATRGAFENHDDYTKHIKEKIIMGIKGEVSVNKE
ncbi:MAG: hypothetical protein JNL24_03225 [Bacteroidia bacterium]|nr:hypothetical protein [Bacteroidia bacterium]